MKQRSIQFSALLIIFLFSGIGSALAEPSGSFLPANVTVGNMSVIINYSGTGFRPGDTVNITADFNTSVAGAKISITDNPNLFGANLVGANNVNLVGADLPTDALMTSLGDNELGGNSFGYDFQIPEDLSGSLGVDISPLDSEGNSIYPSDSEGNLLDDADFSDLDGFGVDPYIEIISPDSEFAGESCVDFNFSAYDDYAGQAGSQIIYTFWLDGVQKNNGVITSGAYKQLQFELDDGSHTWEVKTKDTLGEHTSGTRTLYVDTECPSVTLISPQDCFNQVIGATQFNFTCEDAIAAQYSDLDLSYTLYIDGEPAEDLYGDMLSEDVFSGDVFTGNTLSTTKSGVPVTREIELADGAHNWSVSVEDGAGNSVTSDVRKFYVDLNGFTVSLSTPNGGYVSANPTFNFTVTGNTENNWDSWIGEESVVPGAGLPFDYQLLVDGKEVKGSCDCDCDCDEGYSDDEGDNDCTVGCTEEDCDESCLAVGKDMYSVKAAVADGVNKNWTVIITDRTTGKTYQPTVKHFSVDSVDPACVANLNVRDAFGSTSWYSIRDYPGLVVSWNANTDSDLRPTEPYEVYISTSKPSCIEDMQKVDTSGSETHTDGSTTPNQKLENSSVTDLCIEALDGKDIVYGKDYWVAVIARDNASNYNDAFSMCGPVQTYEDMDLTLEEGWNLKSVPKNLVASSACPESAFGNGTTVLYWDGSCWQFPETIEPCKGYWVYTKEPCTTNVKFRGMSGDCTNPDVPASLELTPGWHIIGHTSSNAAAWSLSLASLNDFDSDLAEDYRFSNLITYSQGEGWGGIIPGVDYDFGTEGQLSESDSSPVVALQSYGYMVPGQGYWIFMKDEGIYASIENVYNLDIAQNTDDGTDDIIDDTIDDGMDDIDFPDDISDLNP